MQSTFEKFKVWVFGAPRDPFNPATRHSMALVAFLAWVGLGADGLSSACYGPEESFLALGAHTHLGFYLAAIMAITVFVIALAYNQVIELFPSGGGGYKITTQLLGSKLGLVAGAALVVDYVLTISISIASGMDAFFSFLSLGAQEYKVLAGSVLILLLMWLNLRGVKEAIRFLLPIFLGFVVSHVGLIIYGILVHADRLPELIPSTNAETLNLSAQFGWAFVVSHLLLAYSQGGGTYTGLEAVSNNVHTLAEPRVRTGQWTMLYMAISLAFTAAGILVLYLLWDVQKVPGQTLNATTFAAILQSMNFTNAATQNVLLVLVLLFEAGLLFVAANTGFLGGPAVLSNMASDSWIPRQFRHLSGRLVTQNGVFLMGMAAIAILIWTKAKVGLLVVLYSVNVFLTFALALLGLCIYWFRHRKEQNNWKSRILLSVLGFVVTASIFSVLLVGKFWQGGLVAVLITGVVIVVCLLIRQHYRETQQQLEKIDQLFAATPIADDATGSPPLVKDAPTAIFFINQHRGVGMHTLLWVQRLFPNHFKNFIFLSVGEVDTKSFSGNETLRTLTDKIQDVLHYFINFCHHNDLAVMVREGYGTDPVEELEHLVDQVITEFPNSVCFASKLIFTHDNFITRLLHNQTALSMQRRLHLKGVQMVVLPMKV